MGNPSQASFQTPKEEVDENDASLQETLLGAGLVVGIAGLVAFGLSKYY